MDNKAVSYKMAIEEIESILKKIESQELDVDELAARLRRVNELVRLCRKKLYAAEKEAEKILGEMEPE